MSGTSTLVRPVLLNAPPPIVLTLSGIVTLVSPLAPKSKLSGIVLTVLPNVAVVMLLLPKIFDVFVKLSQLKCNVVMPLTLLNAFEPIEVTALPNVISLSPVQ